MCLRIHVYGPETIDLCFPSIEDMPCLSMIKPGDSSIVCDHQGTRIGWSRFQDGARADRIKTELSCLKCGCQIQFEERCHGENFEDVMAETAILTVEIPANDQAKELSSCI